jgi:hypothetical protein
MGIIDIYQIASSHLAKKGNFIICTCRDESFIVNEVHLTSSRQDSSVFFEGNNGKNNLRLSESLDIITIEANGIKYRFGDGDTDCGEIIFVSQVKI